jgi:hypothetical protein
MEFSTDTLMEDSDKVSHGKGPKEHDDRAMVWDIIGRSKRKLTGASYITSEEAEKIKNEKEARYKELRKCVRDEFVKWIKEKGETLAERG